MKENLFLILLSEQRVRTFCSNPSGHVVVENHSGIMLANGHAYKDPKLGSPNTNFALLVSHTFSEPFDKPNEYAHEISRLANSLSNGGLIVQKYGDILKGRRSTEKELRKVFFEPTLKEAVPGDLGLVLPYNTLKSFNRNDRGIKSCYTWSSFRTYSCSTVLKPNFTLHDRNLNDRFETEINGLYVGGDGAGITRGLAQASACGVWIARGIIKKTKTERTYIRNGHCL